MKNPRIFVIFDGSIYFVDLNDIPKDFPPFIVVRLKFAHFIEEYPPNILPKSLLEMQMVC